MRIHTPTNNDKIKLNKIKIGPPNRYHIQCQMIKNNNFRSKAFVHHLKSQNIQAVI